MTRPIVVLRFPAPKIVSAQDWLRREERLRRRIRRLPLPARLVHLWREVTRDHTHFRM